jgi:peptide deformylase
MATLPILTAPDPLLKRVCHPVEAVDGELRRLMDDMLDSMYAAPGIGLAAPQVGVLKRVLVVDVTKPDEERRPLLMANPEIVWVSDEDASYEEGCLSVPEHYAEVVRPAAVRVRYLDRDNELREVEADGVLATCLRR